MSIHRFKPEAIRSLVRANLAMLVAIAVHDADHVRQAAAWCYTIPRSLWLLNTAAYAPACAALLLCRRRHRLAAVATALGALLIVALFLKVHLWKSALPLWGIWNRSFFELNVDWISWSALAALAVVGLAACLVGLRVEARSAYEHPAIPW